MTHSIEARMSFFDHRLVEFNPAFGSERKNIGWDTKRVLRRVTESILAALVAERAGKFSFSIPENVWYRGLLRFLVLDGGEAKLQQFSELWSVSTAPMLSADTLDGCHPIDFLFWRVVNLGILGQRFGAAA
jgi:asparagine synthase (glutamine-hydrolysing)